MKSETMTEVSHILEFMKRHDVKVLLSQELRQELNIRDLPAFRMQAKIRRRTRSSILPFPWVATVRS